MKRYPLNTLVNGYTKKIFFTVLSIIIFFSISFYIYFYKVVVDIEEENLVMTLGIFIDNLNDKLDRSEQKFSEVMSEYLTRIYLESSDGENIISGIYEKYKKNIVRDFENSLLSPDRIDYYLISPEGMIIDSSYEMDTGLDMKKYSDFWQNMQEMEEADIFCGNLANEEKSGILRFYSYIKLKNGFSFEIGVSFEDLSGDIENAMEKYISDYNTKMDIYNEEFVSVNNSYIEKLTENEILLFIDSIGLEDFIIHKHLANVVFYKSWISPFGNKFLKINVELDQGYIIILFCIMMSLGFVFLLLIVSGYIRKLVNNLTKSTVILSENMSRFDKDNMENARPISLETSVEEIYGIQKSYNYMLEEINKKVSELKDANIKIKESADENLKLIGIREKILEMVMNIFEFDNKENYFKVIFRNIFRYLEKAEYGMLMIDGDNGMEIIDTYKCSGKEYKKIILDLKEFNFPRKVEIYLNSDESFKNLINRRYSSKNKEIAEVLKKRFNECMVIPIRSNKVDYGIFLIKLSKEIKNSTILEIKKVAEFFAKLLEMHLIYSEYSDMEFAMQRDIILSFIKILEYHDKYTMGHSENVADISVQIGKHMNFNAERLNELYWAGMVHDVGKVLIPDSILNKTSSLTEREFELIKKHPVHAYEILNSAVSMKKVAVFVKYHHERYDGKGYPEQLKYEEIPLESRILSVADAWDSMTRDRIYRKAIKPEKAKQELINNVSTQFDPEIVEIFLEKIYDGK